MHLPSAVWPPTAPAPDDRHGSAAIAPTTPVVAGTSGTWTITYTAGRYGVDDGGAVRIAFHQISDWGTPQFADPAAPDACTVTWSTPAPCRIEPHYAAEAGVRPWRRVLELRVRDAAVRPGDTLTVTFGDRRGGSPGARAQTFAGPMRFQVLLDAFGTGVCVPVGAPLVVPIVPGAPDHLRAHAPSDAVAGQPFTLTVAARDRWGNVVWTRRQSARLDAPGVHVVPVTDPATGLQTESNPVRCHAAGAAPPLAVYWGDLHAQTEETVGAGTLDQYFAFARDCAALDFVGHQGNDFQITREAWERIVATAERYHAPGRFVTFAGYEWSGNTPGGGDHNVHFLGPPARSLGDLHRSSHWQVFDHADAATDRYPLAALCETFRGRDDVLLVPHVGGRYADVTAAFDPALMPLVEVCSCWGVFEWLLDDALRLGAPVGVCAGSDDHTARPGMSQAPRGHFATGGGLTAVLARGRTREAIWEALRARRTYATTGARLLLEVVANGRAPMGAALALRPDEPLELAVRVHGTAPLWRVEVLRWPQVVYAHPFPPPAALPAASADAPGRHRLRIGWTGARVRGRARMTSWDGALTLAAGRILGVTGWGFDHPEHGVVETTAQTVRWRSATAGDWDGIVVELAAPDDAVLTFASAPATFAFRLHDVVADPLAHDAGGIGQRVVVARDPGPTQPRAVAFTYRAAHLPPGAHPYLVRVTQQDGHMAWSSPITVTVATP